MAEQAERGFQKQAGVFLNGKRQLSKKAGGEARFWKNIGLGFRTPKEAIEGHYIDKKCPFTSDVSIRGRILKGIVKSAKMARTVIVRRDYLHFISKYNRYEKRHKNVAAHCSPAFRISEGDYVTIGQCRPLSKTVTFNVLKIDRAAGGAKGVKLFNKF
jgi:small subunit ribosomal protein S11e